MLRLTSSGWRRVATATIRADGTFRANFNVIAGNYRARVIPPTSSGLVAGYSPGPPRGNGLEQLFAWDFPDLTRRVAHHDRARRNVVQDDGTRSDERFLADHDPREQDCASADPCAAANGRASALLVSPLQ